MRKEKAREEKVEKAEEREVRRKMGFEAIAKTLSKNYPIIIPKET